MYLYIKQVFFANISELIKNQVENIRVVQHTSRTSLTLISEYNFVDYEKSKGKWIHFKIFNKQGRFLSFCFELNNSIVTEIARGNQIRNCESTTSKQMYGNMYFEILKIINNRKGAENFNEAITKIFEQIYKNFFYLLL